MNRFAKGRMVEPDDDDDDDDAYASAIINQSIIEADNSRGSNGNSNCGSKRATEREIERERKRERSRECCVLLMRGKIQNGRHISRTHPVIGSGHTQTNTHKCGECGEVRPLHFSSLSVSLSLFSVVPVAQRKGEGGSNIQ